MCVCTKIRYGRVHTDARLRDRNFVRPAVINARATNQLPRARDAQIIASRVTQIAAAAEGANKNMCFTNRRNNKIKEGGDVVNFVESP